ncbi:MAG: MBL fold metallo-hydrolase [Desulfobulbaceae bacterium]
MEIYFNGVGEACDPAQGNTSIHVTTSGPHRILCDCGFTVPHAYFGFCDDPDELDLVWISHFHGDHFFGMPLFLLRLWEMRRTRPLSIIGQPGVEEKVLAALDLAFPRFQAKIGFAMLFRELEPGDTYREGGIILQAVETDHSQRNLGVLIDDGEQRLYYSGDGRPTKAVTELIRGCDIAVHEAFRMNAEVHHHGSISGCLQLAREAGVKSMALVHLERTFRSGRRKEIDAVLRENPQFLLPDKGDTLTLPLVPGA